jgi:hypothetical protein
MNEQDRDLDILRALGKENDEIAIATVRALRDNQAAAARVAELDGASALLAKYDNLAKTNPMAAANYRIANIDSIVAARKIVEASKVKPQ